MGWTALNKPKEMTVEQFFRTEYFGEKSTILKSALKNMREFYAAVKTGDKVWAFVALIDTKKQKGDWTNFAYKDMDETCYPYYFNCPAKILDLLSPTDNESAQKWRKTCREKLAAKKQLVPGMLIKFERPIHFTNGDELQVFELVKGQKRGLRLKSPIGYMFYRIINWQHMKYEVLPEVKTA